MQNGMRRRGLGQYLNLETTCEHETVTDVVEPDLQFDGPVRLKNGKIEVLGRWYYHTPKFDRLSQVNVSGHVYNYVLPICTIVNSKSEILDETVGYIPRSIVKVDLTLPSHQHHIVYRDCVVPIDTPVIVQVDGILYGLVNHCRWTGPRAILAPICIVVGDRV